MLKEKTELKRRTLSMLFLLIDPLAYLHTSSFVAQSNEILPTSAHPLTSRG